MEVSVEIEIAARGLHVYGKTVWQSPRKGEKLTTEEEKKQGSVRYRSLCCGLDAEKKEQINTRYCRSRTT